MPRYELTDPSDEATDIHVIDKKLDKFFKPLMLEVVIFMLKLLTTVLASACLVIGFTAAAAEPTPAPVQEVEIVEIIAEDGTVTSGAVVPQKPWWVTVKDGAAGMWGTVGEKASDLSDGILQPDKKMKQQAAHIKEQNRVIAELEKQLIDKELTLGVKHEGLVMCLEEATDYMQNLLDNQEK
jgi:hypothetical protein